MATIQNLLDQMAEALTQGDTSHIIEISKAIAALEKDAKKARAEAQKGEVEALRVKVSDALRKIVDKYGNDLERLDIKGFAVKGHFTPDQSGTRCGVLYAFSGPKASGGGGGGGGAGKVKAATGMSLQEVFEAHASDTEKAKFAAAETGNAKYAIKHAVYKRLVADGTLPGVA